jgi:TP901 family phage tail tape measure protein
LAYAPIDVEARIKGLSDLQKLERRMEALEKEVTRLQKGLPKATNNVRKFGSASRGASGGVKVLGAAVKSALGPLAAVAAAIGSVTAAFRVIAGQDFALAKVRSLGVDSVALAENLKQVSAELKGNASVAELTGAAYDVASAGFTNAADAAEILKAASLGATGGFTDINTVADAATSVLNAYGKSAKDAGKIVDQFIQTQNDGKIVVAEYAANISKVAPVASALGIELAEVNAVIAQVTAGGTNAEVAFTGLKTALAQLASGNANKALADLGIEITQADIASEGLIGVLKKIKASGIDVGTAFKAFGNEAGPVLQAVFNDLEKTERLLKNQEGAAGAAAKAQQEAANTINGAWGRVRVAFENLFSDQAALAQAIIPILDAVATAVTGITKALEGLKLVAQQVAGVVNNLGEKFGAVGEALGTFGDAAKWAADQLGRLLLRADGFESMDKSGWGKGLRNFGADYKEQELALAAAANKASSAAGTLPKPTATKVPGFTPTLSGGPDASTKAAEQEADRVADTLRSREQLVQRLEAQLAVQKANGKWDQIEKELALETLEVNQRYDNLLKDETNELIIQNTERARALDLEMQLSNAQQDRFTQAQNEFTAFYKNEQEVNKELTKTEELLKGAYETVAGNLTSGIQGLIDGTKEWGDILSDIAGQLGQMFLQAGFSALGGGLGIPGFAEGGRPPTGQVSVVGENGPELFVPDSPGQIMTNGQSRAQMDQYSPGNQGQSSGGSSPTFKLETTVINGVEYATVEQVQAMGRTATKNGAAQGQALTMKSLKNNRSSRSQIGI